AGRSFRPLAPLEFGLRAAAAPEVGGQRLDAFKEQFPRIAWDDEEPVACPLEVHLAGVHAEFFGQPDRLAAAVAEDLGHGHGSPSGRWYIPNGILQMSRLSRWMTAAKPSTKAGANERFAGHQHSCLRARELWARGAL